MNQVLAKEFKADTLSIILGKIIINKFDDKFIRCLITMKILIS